jgi:hypothetical protein
MSLFLALIAVLLPNQNHKIFSIFALIIKRIFNNNLISMRTWKFMESTPDIEDNEFEDDFDDDLEDDD